jgi:hypothetical protein
MPEPETDVVRRRLSGLSRLWRRRGRAASGESDG